MFVGLVSYVFYRITDIISLLFFFYIRVISFCIGICWHHRWTGHRTITIGNGLQWGMLFFFFQFFIRNFCINVMNTWHFAIVRLLYRKFAGYVVNYFDWCLIKDYATYLELSANFFFKLAIIVSKIILISQCKRLFLVTIGNLCIR